MYINFVKVNQFSICKGFEHNCIKIGCYYTKRTAKLEKRRCRMYLTDLLTSAFLVTSVEGREWFMRYPVDGSFLGFPVGISFRSGTNSTPT